ncbi:MAG: membrane protein insertase YidC [Verrucomicrobiota bacterium]
MNMDRTTWIVMITCFLLLFFYDDIAYYFYPEWKQPAPTRTTETPPANDPATPVPSDLVTPAQDTSSPTPVIGQDENAVPSRPVNVPESVAVLSNEYFDVAFTNWGGAIKTVTLHKHESEDGDRVVLNNGSPIAVFSISGWPGMPGSFTAKQITEDSITYEVELQPGVRLERIYTIGAGYQIQCIQTVYVSEGHSVVMSPYHMALGTMAPIHGSAEERRFTGMAWHTPNPGGDYEESSMSSFYPGFMGLWGNKSELLSDKGEDIQWAAINTQYFALIMNMGSLPGQEMRAIKQRLPDARDETTGFVPEGIMASVQMPGFQVNSSFSQTFNLYAGPKEANRLYSMPEGEAKLLEFSFMAFISKHMLKLMNWIHTGVNGLGVPHAYGVAIIIMTIILRAVLWWPQTKANKSMKRMQTVAPLMKDIQQKYKEKPEKLNQEMMKLYQDYGVNPFGGCLPMLIQFPIFLGFYYMLLGSIELRHEHFIWITDLSQPDTIFQIKALEFIPGFRGNINPMPLVMAVTMYITMTITPQPTGVDNPMMKVMKFMPVLFLVFCYNFASALSLYWTMQNLLSIAQMKYNMKHEPPTLEALKEEAMTRKKARKERSQGFGMSARKKKRK